MRVGIWCFGAQKFGTQHCVGTTVLSLIGAFLVFLGYWPEKRANFSRKLEQTSYPESRFVCPDHLTTIMQTDTEPMATTAAPEPRSKRTRNPPQRYNFDEESERQLSLAKKAKIGGKKNDSNGESETTPVASTTENANTSPAGESSTTTTTTTKNNNKLTGAEYRKALTRLLYKNSPLSKIDLQRVFNAHTFHTLLTEDEKRELSSMYLPSVDIGEDGIAKSSMFKSQFFRESLDQMQSLLAEGWLNPNKDLKAIMTENHEKNRLSGTEEPNMNFWLDYIEQMDMSWVKDL